MKCLICSKSMMGPNGYIFECLNCGFLSSTLTPSISDKTTDVVLNEILRKNALEYTRQINYIKILNKLRELSEKAKPKILDVGSAHGWFIKAANNSGFDAMGIEPDLSISRQAQLEGVSIISGFFPDDLPPNVFFDIITFNDVFEHLKSPSQALKSCLVHLNPDGLLAITLPNSQGFFYQTANFLRRIGIKSPLNRMWQYGFPSPHLSYFQPTILAALLHDYGFQEIHRSSLLSLTHHGLWDRLSYAGNLNKGLLVLQYIFLYLFIPIINILPADISFQVFKR